MQIRQIRIRSNILHVTAASLIYTRYRALPCMVLTWCPTSRSQRSNSSSRLFKSSYLLTIAPSCPSVSSCLAATYFAKDSRSSCPASFAFRRDSFLCCPASSLLACSFRIASLTPPPSYEPLLSDCLLDSSATLRAPLLSDCLLDSSTTLRASSAFRRA